MNMRYIILCVLFFPFFTACEKEGTLTPRNTDLTLRFKFPEGNNPWDQDLVDIFEKYATVAIYKNLDSTDFVRSWVVSGGLGVMGQTGKPLDDELAAVYTDFLKNHVLTFFKPELVQGILPNYIYLAQDLRTKMYAGGDNSLPIYWDGQDFWAFCLKMDPKGLSPWTTCFDLPKTPWEYKLRRGVILQNIISKIVTKGKVTVPVEFVEDFDYKTAITSSEAALNDNDPNYYKTRGFPGQFLVTSFLKFTTYNSIRYVNPEKNFTSYLHLSMRYSRDSVLILYPAEKFPKIIKYYDFTVKYMKDNYDWDLTEMERWPVIDKN